jgi:hypothetical protein
MGLFHSRSRATCRPSAQVEMICTCTKWTPSISNLSRRKFHMQALPFTNYILNCILLLLPITAWNAIFASKLPRAYSAEIFEKNISPLIMNGENIARLLVFILPLLMPLRIETQSQKLGLWLYIVGTAIYFLAWLAQIYFPQSTWSLSAFGFLAPAYTPLIWLTGIGLIGSTFFFASPYRSWMYILTSIVFIGFHLSHVLTVYLRNLQ